MIRYGRTAIVCAGLALAFSACGGQTPPPAAPAPQAPAASAATPKPNQLTPQQQADALLKDYFAEYAKLEKTMNLAQWKASNSGKKEDFDAVAKAELALRKLHSDKERYKLIEHLLTQRDELDELTRRSLVVADLAFKENQLPADLLKKIVDASADINKTFNTFRGKLNGKEYSNNELLAMLKKENNNAKRKAIWEALKQVGEAVGPKLVALAKVRNEAAKSLGYKNFWYMEIRLQEHDPDKLLALFERLDGFTRLPFKEMKAKMDAEQARRFHIKPSKMMPWNYDNPFFQEPPPSTKVDLDDFFEGKKKEDIVKISEKFYADIGLPMEDIAARSDLYERKGKDQHAYCMSVDRQGDIRTLLNVKPNDEWMGTMLHEMGHGVYYKYLDYTLPYNLREAAHILTTEGVAMLFGALAQNPKWLEMYAGADPKKVEKYKSAILEQRRREQLIFARWAMVMLHFEKALYDNPDQNLNKLWWETVNKYQMLPIPKGRDAADWAAKPHFTIAPVYYHNYLLGEVYAAQLRHKLAQIAKFDGPTSELSFNDRKDFGKFMKDKVFHPGMRWAWPTFVEKSTGESLNPSYFAQEVTDPNTATKKKFKMPHRRTHK